MIMGKYLIVMMALWFISDLGQAAAGVERGIASFYADKFAGRKTASGELYRHHKLTAAHNSRPFGQRVKVCRQDQPRRCVVVRINDRGPFVQGRIIDLSRAAARQLGILKQGVARVTIYTLQR